MRSDRRNSFFQAGPQNITVFVDGARADQGHFGFAADVIHWRTQVVRNIRGESGNPLEGFFQAVEHFVEGVSQRRQFKRISLRRNPLVQVRRTDVLSRSRNLFDWPNAVPCNLISDQREDREGSQKNCQEPSPVSEANNASCCEMSMAISMVSVRVEV